MDRLTMDKADLEDVFATWAEPATPTSGARLVTRPEARQFVRAPEVFEARYVPYIDWRKFGEEMRELGCDLDVRHDAAGRCHVTLFWRYDAEALRAMRGAGLPVRT